MHLVLLDRVEPVLGRQAFLHGRVLFDRDPPRTADVLKRTLVEYFDGEFHRRMRAEGIEQRRPRAVVDRYVVLRKSETIEHHASRLRAKLPLRVAALDADESLLNDVCFDLLQAIQACIDLAVHACTHDSFGVPENSGNGVCAPRNARRHRRRPLEATGRCGRPAQSAGAPLRRYRPSGAPPRLRTSADSNKRLRSKPAGRRLMSVRRTWRCTDAKRPGGAMTAPIAWRCRAAAVAQKLRRTLTSCKPYFIARFGKRLVWGPS